MKLCEQIVKKPVAASVNELRYAGRRLVDALQRMDTNPDDPKVEPLLVDALFNCHCAQHDAVDVAMDAMAIDFELMERRLGYPAIMSAYPDFAVLLGEHNPARELIAISRKDRSDREAIYDSITNVNLPSLAQKYGALKASQPIMLAFVKRHKRLQIAWWIMAAVAVASMVFGGLQYMEAREAKAALIVANAEVIPPADR
jgi:hypothetical protein